MTHQSGGGSIRLDLACFYEGAAAREEAEHDGFSLGGARWYVRNQNHITVYHPSVASNTQAYWADRLGNHYRLPFADWPAANSLTCPGSSCAVWLEIRGGVVIAVWEQVP